MLEEALGQVVALTLYKSFGSEANSHSVKVRIDPDSGLAYTMWQDIPIPFYMSLYFFEVKNPQEILRGEKPVLEQRGPYVYREYRQKSNITFHSNYTVTYREYRHYHFCPERSFGNESDELILPNMLTLGAALMAEDLSYALKLIFSTALKTFNETPFIKKSVKEIMWGYDDPLVDFLNQVFPGMLPFKGKFGLFADMNNSNTGLFTVFTGVDNITKVHLIDNWNGIKEVNYWHSQQCNLINGTAGEMWPPFITPSDTLTFYSPDSCRTLELVFQKSGWTLDIPSYHYVAPKTMFANGTVYPPNKGFCPCRESGVLNVSTCRHNSQVFISQPHFYNADPVLWKAVDGLNPNEEDHALFIEIHPLTGIPLNVSIKLQLNLFVKAVQGISETGNIKPVLLPLLWFDETGYIDGAPLQTFYYFLVLVPTILEYLQYVLIAVGCLLVLVAIVLEIACWKKQDRNILFWSSKQCTKDKPFASAKSNPVTLTKKLEVEVSLQTPVEGTSSAIDEESHKPSEDVSLLHTDSNETLLE
ncbi:scavenger receptor class B member 1 isoform X2 [Chiloscyllium punctatum]|uniref:scavenger receptor class B member 1 isoform X2 n=1 Tax=Chiloscyllium punctatum TaxID=137246 RepID=UPI003B63B9DF